MSVALLCRDVAVHVVAAGSLEEGVDVVLGDDGALWGERASEVRHVLVLDEEDVGALVTEINREMTKVILVNINQGEQREVTVQTGGYGEHQCLYAEINGRSIPVNKRYFTLRLAPGAGAEIDIYTRRFANKPTLAFPWHGDSVPLVMDTLQ